MGLARLEKNNRLYRGKFFNCRKISYDEGDFHDLFQGLINTMYNKFDKTTPISPQSRPRFQSGSNRDRCERHITKERACCFLYFIVHVQKSNYIYAVTRKHIKLSL